MEYHLQGTEGKKELTQNFKASQMTKPNMRMILKHFSEQENWGFITHITPLKELVKDIVQQEGKGTRREEMRYKKQGNYLSLRTTSKKKDRKVARIYANMYFICLTNFSMRAECSLPSDFSGSHATWCFLAPSENKDYRIRFGSTHRAESTCLADWIRLIVMALKADLVSIVCCSTTVINAWIPLSCNV